MQVSGRVECFVSGRTPESTIFRVPTLIAAVIFFLLLEVDAYANGALSPMRGAEERIADYTLALTFFTAVLAAATVGLLWATYQLGVRADRNVQALERAFIYVSGGTWTGELDAKTNQLKGWGVSVSWMNSGKTPTRNLHTWVQLEVVDQPLDTDHLFVERGDFAALRSFIAPGSSISSDPPLKLSLEDWDAMKEGKKHVYVWGWAEYDDVFDGTRRHRTEFCHKWRSSGPVEDFSKVTFWYGLFSRLNGADAECLGPLKTSSPLRT